MRYTGQPRGLAPEDQGAEVGLSRAELVDGLAQCARELQELRDAAADRDFTPAEADVWDAVLDLAARYRTAVQAIDAAPPD